MEQTIEETSRAESSHKGEMAIVKLEDNQDESPCLPNADTIDVNPIAARTFVVNQDYVGDNDFTGDVERSRRRRSDVWKDFTEDTKPDGSAAAKCKRCGVLLVATSTSGTSHLHRHVKVCCTRKRYGDVKQMLLSPSFKAKGGDSDGFKFDEDGSRKNLAKFVICAELPFNIVEQPAFVNFVRSLHPSFRFGSQEMVRDNCVVLCEEEKAKIHSMLKNLDSCVSFTFDIWRLDQNAAYMAFNASFIDDDFVLRKKMLNFKRITRDDKSYMINDEIENCIIGWQLDGKVFALTLDSSTVHDILPTRFKENWIEKFLTNGNYLRIRCCANVLNTMIEDGIKALHCSIERIRNIFKHVTATASHMQEFNGSAQQHGLAMTKVLNLDVSTKWNATYDMLQDALSYKDVFIEYARVHFQEIDAPRPDDWEKVEVIMKFLKAFVNAMDVFSRTRYPTANLYLKELWTIWRLLQYETASCNETVRNVTSEMEKKLRYYWSECNMILAIASILDPRFKFLLIEYCYVNAFCEEEAKEKITEIRDCLYKLYNHYEKTLNAKKHASSEESSAQGSSGLSEGSSTVELSFKRKLELEFTAYLAQNSLKRPKRNDLDTYLDANALPDMEDEDFCVLSWWKRSAELYPVLSMMARDVLAIPVCTFISKSAFDACRRLTERSSIPLDSSSIETFICAQDWFHDDCHADANGICDVPVPKSSDV